MKNIVIISDISDTYELKGYERGVNIGFSVVIFHISYYKHSHNFNLAITTTGLSSSFTMLSNSLSRRCA